VNIKREHGILGADPRKKIHPCIWKQYNKSKKKVSLTFSAAFQVMISNGWGGLGTISSTLTVTVCKEGKMRREHKKQFPVSCRLWPDERRLLGARSRDDLRMAGRTGRRSGRSRSPPWPMHGPVGLVGRSIGSESSWTHVLRGILLPWVVVLPPMVMVPL
jgi:hypothetical protein